LSCSSDEMRGPDLPSEAGFPDQKIDLPQALRLRKRYA